MYNEELLEHNLHPSYKGELATATDHYKVINSSCGDKLTIYLQIKDNVVVDASWNGVGCAISQASADIMLEQIIGKTLKEVKGLHWQDQPALAGVKNMPARIKCASLAWGILQNLPTVL